MAAPDYVEAVATPRAMATAPQSITAVWVGRVPGHVTKAWFLNAVSAHVGVVIQDCGILTKQCFRNVKWFDGIILI